MNIVIPMAGRGSRFEGAGMNVPKPLIPVAGKPMVAWALESVQGIPCSRMIFIVLEEHEKQYKLSEILPKLVEADTELILLKDVTEGQLCTVLAAKEWINIDEDLLIISSDTLVFSNIGKDIAERSPDCHGIISTALMPGERWSFARTDESGQVVEVAEKVRISDNASTGLYYFTSGLDFVAVAKDMICRGEKTGGEYFVIPVYQKYIEKKWRVDISQADEMWDMGTPEALNEFKKHLDSKKV